MIEVNTSHEVFSWLPDKIASFMPSGTKVEMFGRNFIVGKPTRKTNIMNIEVVEMYHEGKYIGTNSRLSLCYYELTGKLKKV